MVIVMNKNRRLQEIRDRAEKATEGPWCLVSNNQIHDRETKFNNCGVRIGETPNLIAVEKCPNGSENAEFIAHARQDIPYLLDALQQAQEENKKLKNKLTNIKGRQVIDHIRAVNSLLSKERVYREALEFYKNNCSEDGGCVAMKALEQEVKHA